MGGINDMDLADWVLHERSVRPEDINDCRDYQEEMVRNGNAITLGEAMIHRGVLDRGDVKRISRTLSVARKLVIPGYRILSLLGAGAMATVYKAHQESLDRIVAIKILPRRLSQNAEYVQRFYAEGRAAAKLNHPNIVQAIDVVESNGRHFFIMEYAEGRTLHDDLEGGKVYSEAQAVNIATQVARALEHAHSMGIIHRDVKPKNIILTPTGLAKLADMGLARLASDDEADLSERGKAFGTPYYISPEQIRGQGNIDFRADIYSLGATFYHMLTGQVPYEGETAMEVMEKHISEPLTPPDHIRTELSAGIGEVVEVMMAKQRRYRYRSSSELLLDLEAIADGDPPLMARQHIDTEVLGELAQGETALPAEPQEGLFRVDELWKLYVIIFLSVALILSMVLNILLLMQK
jgi:serine/threonine-protein kinase